MAEGKKGFFGRLVEGLTKTRNSIVSGIDSIFSGFSAIDDDFYEEIEEILVMGDIGINTTTKIIDLLKERVAEEHITDPAECKQLLIESIKKQMDVGDTAYDSGKKQYLSLSGTQQKITAEFQKEMANTVQEFITINNLILESDYYQEKNPGIF